MAYLNQISLDDAKLTWTVSSAPLGSILQIASRELQIDDAQGFLVGMRCVSNQNRQDGFVILEGNATGLVSFDPQVLRRPAFDVGSFLKLVIDKPAPRLITGSGNDIEAGDVCTLQGMPQKVMAIKPRQAEIPYEFMILEGEHKGITTTGFREFYLGRISTIMIDTPPS